MIRDSVQNEDGQSSPSTSNNGSLTATIRANDFSFFPPAPERPVCAKTSKTHDTLDASGGEYNREFKILKGKMNNTVKDVLNQFKALVSIGDPNKRYIGMKQIGKG